MAQTKKGQKFNRIESYKRKAGKKKVKVRTHDRSNPTTSHGKAHKKRR